MKSVARVHFSSTELMRKSAAALFGWWIEFLLSRDVVFFHVLYRTSSAAEIFFLPVTSFFMIVSLARKNQASRQHSFVLVGRCITFDAETVKTEPCYGMVCYDHSRGHYETKARFSLPELTARVNGPSWRVTGFHYPSTRAVLTGARFH